MTNRFYYGQLDYIDQLNAMETVLSSASDAAVAAANAAAISAAEAADSASSAAVPLAIRKYNTGDYSVATASFIPINLPTGSQNLTDGYIYRVELETLGTNTINGSVYYAYNTAIGIWALYNVSRASNTLEHPLLRISVSGTKLEVYHNSGSTFTIRAAVMSLNSGSNNPSKNFAGIEGYFSSVDGVPAHNGSQIWTASSLTDLGQLTNSPNYATVAYADSLVVSMWDDRGNYDASSNVFPTTGGSGASGAVKKNDIWTISVPGTLGGTPVAARQFIRALVDAPGQTATNWAISLANTDIDDSITNGVIARAPSQNAVYDALILKAPLASPALTGTPTVPTPALGIADTTIPSAAFVQNTINGILSKSVAGGSNVTLTTAEAGNGIWTFTGALTANIDVIVPNTSKRVIVLNRTSGAFTLRVKTSAGTGVFITQGKQQEVICDGTNVFYPENDVVPNPWFSGVITGDFSNATLGNRLLFQSNTVNGQTSVGAISNGTSTTAQFVAFGGSDANNANYITAGTDNTSAFVDSSKTGTGTIKPLLFKIGGIERFRLNETSNLFQADMSNATQSSRFAFQTTGANAGTTLGVIPNGTATTSVLALYETTDMANSGRLLIGTDGVTDFIRAESVGTGTVRPLTISTGGTERIRLLPSSARLQADWSNATISSQLAFQTSATNSLTSVNIVPNGTSQQAQIVAFNNSTPDNASFTRMGTNGTVSYLTADRAGTGTFLPLTFNTGGAEAMRIDTSGNIMFGITTSGDPVGIRTNGTIVNQTTKAIYSRYTTAWELGIAASSGLNMQFYTDNGSAYVSAGSISSNGATTAFNTSSDYRIKVDPVPMVGALESLKQIQFKTWKWVVDGRNGEGVVAHELQAIDQPIEDAVHGEKDGMKIGKSGQEEPYYQSVDYSKLVPRIGCSVQELSAMLDKALERIAALEAALK